MRTCTTCGKPITTGTRCPTHPTTPRLRGTGIRRQQRLMLEQATHCALCGQPPTPNNPLVIDHRIPLAHGGPDQPTNWQAAHRTCNLTKGAT